MKTLLSLGASLALLSRLAAGEDRSYAVLSRALGSRAPPLSSAWTSKAAAAPAGSIISRSSKPRPLATPSSTSGGDHSHRRRRPHPASGSSSRGDELAMLRGGGWLGVDLVKEIAKAYISPPSAPPAEDGRGAAGAAPVAAPTTSDKSDPGAGRGRGAGDGGETATTAAGRVAGGDQENNGASSGGGGGGADEGRESAGGSGGAGGVQGKIGRIRSALQQVGDVTSSTNPPAAPTTNPPAGNSGNSNGNNNNNPKFEGELGGRGGTHSNAPESSSNGNAASPGAVGNGPSGTDYNSNNHINIHGYNNNGGSDVEAELRGTAAPSAEDQQQWESTAGGGGWGEQEEEELSRAQAAFDAALEDMESPTASSTKGDAASPEAANAEEKLERETAELESRTASIEAVIKETERETAELDAKRAQNELQDRMDGPQGGPYTLGQWGEYTRSVVTNVMPARFIDDFCAHIASALAVVAFKGLFHVLTSRGGKRKQEKVAFKDVVGCDEAKEEVQQIVDFLVNPSAYDSLGASRPKGILLVGPPGTGKTLIAKACAGEAGIPFISANGSDFNGVFVGMGVAAVKRLFAGARKHKKCIIYIDEIDSVGRKRGGGSREASGATQDREATLNQLLSEMDGFSGKDGVVVMASTNRKEILDDALLRSGRFDMQVDVERPDRKGRAQLFSKYIAPLKLCDEEHSKEAAAGGGRGRDHGRGRGGRWGPSSSAMAMAAEKEKEAAIKKEGLREDIAKELADMTPYMTGADVANVCATAGRIAARAGSESVVLEHFSAAVDRVTWGLEKPDKEVSKEEKERTAIHEAGHAVAAWMLPWCDEVVKVSIVWRGNALGFSQTAMVERLSQMREMVLDRVCMILAGRAAEEVVCKTISGGARNDLRVASQELYSAITEVGFGNTSLLAPGNRQLSEKVMSEVDEEVQTLLAQQYQRALALVRTHRDKIDGLAKALLDQNVVHKADLRKILGEKVTLESEEAAAAAALNAALAKAEDGKSAPAAAPEQGDSTDAAAAAAPNNKEEAHSVRKTDAAAMV